MKENIISFEDFQKVDIRVGTIIEAVHFEKARVPAYQLIVDFGPLGTRKSSAQITVLYSKKDLTGKKVLAVVNFAPKQIANFMSECLVLGVQNGEEVVLLHPSEKVKKGTQVL